MGKLLLITGDIAAGKSTFSEILSKRYKTATFQKDVLKEILGDTIGFHNREENKRLSDATIEIMCHIFSKVVITGNSLILESNFHEAELKKLHEIARNNQYDVLTLVLRGDAEILYDRYLFRMNEENRHPVHLSTSLHIKEDFIRTAKWIRNENVIGDTLLIEANNFSYQENLSILRQIDAFMEGQSGI